MGGRIHHTLALVPMPALRRQPVPSLANLLRRALPGRAMSHLGILLALGLTAIAAGITLRILGRR